MKKYLFLALSLVFFACGQDDEDNVQSTRTGGEDATLGENQFLGEEAYRVDISIECGKCSEGSQNQEHTLFLQDVKYFDQLRLKQINYTSYDEQSCETHDNPAWVELTVTNNDNSSQVYHILETACDLSLTEGRFITKEDFTFLANLAY